MRAEDREYSAWGGGVSRKGASFAIDGKKKITGVYYTLGSREAIGGLRSERKLDQGKN